MNIYDSQLICKALKFAEKAHRGQCRKGKDTPYIVHPVEAAFISMTLTEDEEIIAAVLLHDVLEDTEVTADELKELFGERVTALVEAESEKKDRSQPAENTWHERKSAALRRIHNANRDVKVLFLSDKLSNMRACAEDMEAYGDEMWTKFNNRNKADHEWYYRSMAEELRCFEGTEAYTELLALTEKVFKGE